MDPRYKSPTANVDIEVDEDFRDIEGLTNVLKWMLWAGAMFGAIGLVSSFLQLNMLSASFTPEQEQANTIRQQSVNGLILLYFIATAVVFGRWIVLAHRNLPALGARYVEFTPGWAVGWFFIPIANIWMPFKAMRFLWRSSHSVQRPELQENTWVLTTWWSLWIANWFLQRAAQSAELRALDVERLITVTYLDIIVYLVNIALHLVAAILVIRIWEAQRTQKENPGEFDPSPGFADPAIQR